MAFRKVFTGPGLSLVGGRVGVSLCPGPDPDPLEEPNPSRRIFGANRFAESVPLRRKRPPIPRKNTREERSKSFIFNPAKKCPGTRSKTQGFGSNKPYETPLSVAATKKILRYSGLGFLGLLIVLLLLLPGLVKNYAVKNSRELLGRQISMDKLRVNYFTGTVKVYDFNLYEANGQDVFVAFDTLVLNTAPYKYFSGVKALDRFYLEGLEVRVAKKDSTFNFDDLVAFHSAEDSSATKSGEEEAFKYLLENLELKNAAFRYYDADLDHTTDIENFSLFIPVIAWDQEHDSNADIAFRLGESAAVKASSNVNPATGDFSSTVEIDNLQLSAFYKYALEYATINSLEGTVNAVIELTGNVNRPVETLVSGEVEALKPLMTDLNGVGFLSAEKILCTLGEINYNKSSYTIDALVIEQPYVKFELDSVSNNLFRIFKYDTEAGDSIAAETEAEDSLYYALNRVQVRQGRMDYTDNLTGQPFNYALSEIEIDTDSIFSDSEWVDIQSTMVLNKRGNLKAEIGYNPADPDFATLDIAIEDFLLSDLNLYSGYYTGHSILTGDMFYFSETKITDGQLESENNLLIKDVAVENIKGGLFSIPLKIAVWLLRDKNGNIELDIPVRGNLDDPTVDAWALVGTTLKKKLFDATDNPVKPLARFIGADPKDLESLAFQYPDTIPNAEQARQLDLLLELERQKEGVEIVMNLVGQDSLVSLMAENRAGELFKQKTKADYTTDREAFEKFVYEQVGSDSLGLSGSIRSLTAAQNVDSLANTYMDALIRNLSGYLKGKQSTTTIVVQKAKVSNPDNADAAPQFKMNYSLKGEEPETPAAPEASEGLPPAPREFPRP
jgi:hypothetical protein